MLTTTHITRTAIYARYSSREQDGFFFFRQRQKYFFKSLHDSV